MAGVFLDCKKTERWHHQPREEGDLSSVGSRLELDLGAKAMGVGETTSGNHPNVCST